jgi:hypothetical protein
MWNKMRNERGMMLPDLVASLPLGVIVMAVMTFSVINFLIAYNDLRDYTKLQDDLLQAVETLRYGYVQRGVNTNSQPLCGVLTANQVLLNESGNSVTFVVDSDPSISIRSRYMINGEGMLYLRGNYGSQLFSSPFSSSGDVPIFPKSDRRVDGELKFRILNPSRVFNDIVSETDTSTQTDYIRLLGVNIEAQVRFRPRSNDQSEAEDLRTNTRRIEYNTKIYVPNVPSQV